MLRHVHAKSQRSRDRAGSSSGGGAPCDVSEDRATRKHSALLPLRRPNLKCPFTTGGGSQGLSSSTPSGLSFVDLRPFDRGVGVGGRSKADTTVVAHGASLDALTVVVVPLLGRGVMSFIFTPSISCSKSYVTS